jgi:hypothetical protein
MLKSKTKSSKSKKKDIVNKSSDGKSIKSYKSGGSRNSYQNRLRANSKEIEKLYMYQENLKRPWSSKKKSLNALSCKKPNLNNLSNHLSVDSKKETLIKYEGLCILKEDNNYANNDHYQNNMIDFEDQGVN